MLRELGADMLSGKHQGRQRSGQGWLCKSSGVGGESDECRGEDWDASPVWRKRRSLRPKQGPAPIAWLRRLRKYTVASCSKAPKWGTPNDCRARTRGAPTSCEVSDPTLPGSSGSMEPADCSITAALAPRLCELLPTLWEAPGGGATPRSSVGGRSACRERPPKRRSAMGARASDLDESWHCVGSALVVHWYCTVTAMGL